MVKVEDEESDEDENDHSPHTNAIARCTSTNLPIHAANRISAVHMALFEAEEVSERRRRRKRTNERRKKNYNVYLN